MKSQTRYLTFETRRRRVLVRIPDEVAALAAADRTPGPDYRHHRGGEDDGDAHLGRCPQRFLLQATGE